jgi:uncharacterized protein YecT (DUF1311 family)
MRRISIFGFLLAVSVSAWCQSTSDGRQPRASTSQSVPCDESGAQNQLNVCASEAAEREDAALGKARKGLMAELGEHSEEQKLVSTEEAKWEAYRKAQMVAVYPLAHVNGQVYGSVMPMCFDNDWQTYTAIHQEELGWMRPPGTKLCQAGDAERADEELNSVYRQLLAKLASDHRARTALIEAERAWIQYRDAMLAALDSVHPDKTGNCRAFYASAIAQERTRDLNSMLHPEDGDVCEYDHPMSKEDLENYGIKDP